MSESSTQEWENTAGRTVDRSTLNEKYRLKFRLEKDKFKFSVPKSEENETHVTIYIEPANWPQEK